MIVKQPFLVPDPVDSLAHRPAEDEHISFSILWIAFREKREEFRYRSEILMPTLRVGVTNGRR